MDYRKFADYLLQERKISNIDYYFADFAARRSNCGENPPLFLLAALVSRASSIGREVCLSAAKVATAEALREYLALPEDVEVPADGWLPAELPEFLVSEGGNYYLRGNYLLEMDIRDFVEARASGTVVEGEFDPAVTTLDLTEGQIATVKAARQNRFLIVSGGPGTGKTTILATILALRGEDPERICLAAPTGKAQGRMQEALREELEKINISEERKTALKDVRCSTVHRLLEADHMGKFRRNRENPLECDLLVVDECSMLSFDLLGQLFRALSEKASVILLGDHAQLASVQPGQIFADLCSMMSAYPEGHLAKLTESKRFPADKGIARLRDRLEPHLDQPGAEAWECLQANYEQLEYKPLPPSAELPAFLAENLYGWRENGKPFFEAETIEEAWERFESMRILVPTGEGKFGADAVNGHIKHIFKLGENSPGLPLMQRKNDYMLNIFNGDTGLLWYADKDRKPLPRSCAAEDCKRLVFFPRGNGEWYGVERELLEDAEVAFAMTVHKSQGSGYGKVLFILPELGFGEKLLTRELIYTAVTRGKPEAVVVTTRDVFCAAANRRTERASGLLSARF